MATTPTELIVTEGPADYVPIEGTQLLYVQEHRLPTCSATCDTTSLYVLISGRWFNRTVGVRPWQFVPGAKPAARLQEYSRQQPEGRGQSLGAGHPQAQKRPSPTASRIRPGSFAQPQTTIPIDGPPKVEPIRGTPLSYVVNSEAPDHQGRRQHLVRMPGTGVWFVATSPIGPWTMAASVPAVIYSIPPSSPDLLRHVRSRLRCLAAVCLCRLHAGLLRHGDRRRRRGGVRHGLLLQPMGRKRVLRPHRSPTA